MPFQTNWTPGGALGGWIKGTQDAIAQRQLDTENKLKQLQMAKAQSDMEFQNQYGHISKQMELQEKASNIRTKRLKNKLTQAILGDKVLQEKLKTGMMGSEARVQQGTEQAQITSERADAGLKVKKLEYADINQQLDSLFKFRQIEGQNLENEHKIIRNVLYEEQAPHLVDQWFLDKEGQVLQNEAARLDNEYARETLQPRVTKALADAKQAEYTAKDKGYDVAMQEHIWEESKALAKHKVVAGLVSGEGQMLVAAADQAIDPTSAKRLATQLHQQGIISKDIADLPPEQALQWFEQTKKKLANDTEFQRQSALAMSKSDGATSFQKDLIAMQEAREEMARATEMGNDYAASLAAERAVALERRLSGQMAEDLNTYLAQKRELVSQGKPVPAYLEAAINHLTWAKSPQSYLLAGESDSPINLGWEEAEAEVRGPMLEPGEIYELADGTRMKFKGGDINDPNNHVPVQGKNNGKTINKSGQNRPKGTLTQDEGLGPRPSMRDPKALDEWKRDKRLGRDRAEELRSRYYYQTDSEGLLW